MGRGSRLAVTVAVALTVALLAPWSASGHEDAGGPERLDDRVDLVGFTFEKVVGENGDDTDDGGGDSELCIVVSWEHPLHEHKASTKCVDVDWDAIVPGSDPPTQWEFWEGTADDGWAEMPLIPGQLDNEPVLGPQHTMECQPSEPWTMTVVVNEIDTTFIDEILQVIAKVLGAVPSEAAPWAPVAGKAAEEIAGLIKKLFEGEDYVGDVTLEWATGEGDPSGVVDKSEESEPLAKFPTTKFEVEGTKTVAQREPDCPTTTSSSSTTSTSEPPTSEPPTSEPPTSEPPTSAPPTSEPPTSEPPTSEPPTSEPPTSEPPTSTTGTTVGSSTTGGPPSSLAAAAVAAAEGCGRDGLHLLCKDVDEAHESWNLLRRAARMIRAIAAEPGTGETDVTGSKRAAVDLVGGIGLVAAREEIAEAAGTAGFDPLTLFVARVFYRLGETLLDTASNRVDVRSLVWALNAFEFAYGLVARELHPEFN